MNFPILYQILDVCLELKTDDKHLLERFEMDYRSFRELNQAKPRVSRLTKLQVEASTTGLSPHLVIDGISHSLVGHTDPVDHVSAVLVKEIFRRVTSFLLIHAAVAVKDDGAVVLAGNPGTGKTTLLMRLIDDEGFLFFSDDVCPIQRSSGRIFPFPRTAWVSDTALTELRTQKRKRPVSVAAPDNRLGPVSCSPGCVILLQTPTGERPGNVRKDPDVTQGKASERKIVPIVSVKLVLKSQPSAELVTDLSVPGVAVSTYPGEMPGLIARYHPACGAAARLREAVERHQDEIWSFHRMKSEKADFSGEPQARRIGTSELALHLAAQLKQDFFQPTSDLSPGRLMFELSSLFAGVDAYEVTTGRLDSMVRLVKRIRGD